MKIDSVRQLLNGWLPSAVIEIRQAFRAIRRIAPHKKNPLLAALSGRERAMLTGSRLAYLPLELLQSPICVVDVGAHVGHWSEAMVEFASPQMVVAIEPSPEAFARLKAGVGTRAGVRLHQCAVGACAGKAVLNLMSSPDFNSLLALTGSAARHYGGVERLGEVEVEVLTLDDLLKNLKEISLLKLDVQGDEIPVLQGARETLRRTRAVLLEMNFVSHYDGDACFDDLHRFMTDQCGFRLQNIAPPFYNREGQALWIDAVYVRK